MAPPLSFLQGPNRAFNATKEPCHLREGGDPGVQKQGLIHVTLDSRLRGSDGGGIKGRDTLPSRPEQGPLAYASEAKQAEACARRLRAFLTNFAYASEAKQAEACARRLRAFLTNFAYASEAKQAEACARRLRAFLTNFAYASEAKRDGCPAPGV